MSLGPIKCHRKIIIVAVNVSLVLSFIICSTLDVEAGGSKVSKADFAVVKLFPFGQTVRIEAHDPAVVLRVTQWLARVSPRQPTETELGAVLPWCSIFFYRKARLKPILVKTADIYMYADSTESRRLLTDSEVQEFHRILQLDKRQGVSH